MAVNKISLGHMRAKRKRRKKVWNLSNKKCFYCNRDLVFDGPKQPNKMTIEHLIPQNQGGTNKIENLVAACLECNQKRGSKKIKDFVDPPKPKKPEPLKCSCDSPRLVLNAKRECVCILCQGYHPR